MQANTSASFKYLDDGRFEMTLILSKEAVESVKNGPSPEHATIILIGNCLTLLLSYIKDLVSSNLMGFTTILSHSLGHMVSGEPVSGSDKNEAH